MTVGAKGGTGKSTALRYLITYLQEAGIEPFLIDADDENATLFRFFGHAQKIVPRLTKSYDVIINTAEKGLHPLIIVDLKAGVGLEMLQWASILPYSDLKQLGITFLLLAAITSSPDSVSSLLRWVDCLGKEVRWMVVKNLKDSDAFGLDPESVSLPEYDLTKQALEFRKKFKPATIVMPGLDPEYQAELERNNLTIRDVLARRPGVPEVLTPLIVRARLRNYQAALYRQFDAHKELLLPEL